MKLLRLLFLRALLGLGLVASHHGASAQSSTPTPPLQEPELSRRMARAILSDDSTPKSLSSSAPKYLGYRRYQGTVQGRPVLVELTLKWVAYPGYFSWNGTYYYLDSGVAYPLDAAHEWTNGQSLELTANNQQLWCATQGLGPTLSGTCFARSGRPLGTFMLRESYAGAVRYEILEEQAPGRVGRDNFDEPATAAVKLHYLHLLSNSTLRPALAQLQCPGPAQRRRAQRRLAAELTPTPRDLAMVYQESKWVTLNEADILSYHASLEESVVRKRHGEHSGQQVLLDLRTGRALDPLAQLRPGGLTALRRLLARRALRDTAAAARQWLHKGLMDEPEEGFIITPAGWEATYTTAIEDWPFSAYNVAASWAELRPLLRTDSPLQRIIKARGF